MTTPKLKTSPALALVILLVGGFPPSVFSGNAASDNLLPVQILKGALDKYASLSSYSDEGKIVTTLSGKYIRTTFTIRLARPNLYRIEWQRNHSPSPGQPTGKTEAVWSAGNGDFLDMGTGARKLANQEMALGSANSISGGAAAKIPGTFFKMNLGNPLGGFRANGKRQNDEKVGGIDCYVLTSDLEGKTTTLWIGKQDFLMHQIRLVMSADAVTAMLARAAKANPGVVAPNQSIGGMSSIETHTNIIVNQKFSPADFSR